MMEVTLKLINYQSRNASSALWIFQKIVFCTSELGNYVRTNTSTIIVDANHHLIARIRKYI